MKELHIWGLGNFLNIVEALVKERYDFKVECSSNGSYNITLPDIQTLHSNMHE